MWLMEEVTQIHAFITKTIHAFDMKYFNHAIVKIHFHFWYMDLSIGKLLESLSQSA